ncbi:DoxX-like family protein, partial [Roseateles oligotrophus]
RMHTMPSALSFQVALERIRRLCNFTVAGIWLYQGLVPKLLGPHPDELAMSIAFGIPTGLQASVSYAAGIGEVLLGLCVLLLPRRAWPQLVSMVATAVLLAFVAIYTPRYLIGAFNPVVMNVASISLSIVALLAFREKESSAG